MAPDGTGRAGTGRGDGATLPREMAERVEASLGAGAAGLVLDGIEEARERPVTLRANALRASAQEVEAELRDAGIEVERVPWYADALIARGVRERALWDTDAYREGRIYLQSLSSMMPPLALDPAPGADILDMCAAPGGKTSEIAALAGGRAHITACEMKAPRAEKLEYNLAKLGVAGANVMRVDARRLDEFFSFDQILLDAPCTGTGTLRAGDARAASRMTGRLLERTVRSQRALLDRALSVLKPGGVLVYSTCSVLSEENSDAVEAALGRHGDCELVPLDAAPAEDDALPEPGAATARFLDAVRSGAVPVHPCGLPGTLTVLPSRDYEGFFIAKIKKGR